MEQINNDNWQSEVIDSTQTTIVYFWATWCQPCKMQKLVLAQLLEELPELKIVGVDADKQEELVKAHNVSSIPTLILYKQGEPAWTLSGAKPLGVLREKVLPYV